MPLFPKKPPLSATGKTYGSFASASAPLAGAGSGSAATVELADASAMNASKISCAVTALCSESTSRSIILGEHSAAELEAIVKELNSKKKDNYFVEYTAIPRVHRYIKHVEYITSKSPEAVIEQYYSLRVRPTVQAEFAECYRGKNLKGDALPTLAERARIQHLEENTRVIREAKASGNFTTFGERYWSLSEFRQAEFEKLYNETKTRGEPSVLAILFGLKIGSAASGAPSEGPALARADSDSDDDTSAETTSAEIARRLAGR